MPGLSLENTVPATVTLNGKDYPGYVKWYFMGQMQPLELVFVPNEDWHNEILTHACNSRESGHWWSDLGYTVDQKGLSSIFPSYNIDDEEAWRRFFAEQLGSALKLPKILDIQSIPDIKQYSEERVGSVSNHVWEMYEAGIIGGVDAYGTFAHDKTLTRAEAAVMVARIIDPAQRLTTPPKPMPKDGEGYTLTYLMDGVVDSWMYQDTYPYFFVSDQPGGITSEAKSLGFLKLDGTFTPWPEGMESTALTRNGGDKMFWTVNSGVEQEDGTQYVEGVTNDRMEWIIEPQYETLYPCEGGYAAATWDDRYLFLDETGREVKEVASWEGLPGMPLWTEYYVYWKDW